MTSPAWRVFDASLDDDRIVDLFTRMHSGDASIPLMTVGRWRTTCGLAMFAGGKHCRIVERGGEIIALVTIGKAMDPRAGGVVWRMRIFVDPSVRREGIAKALFHECETDARSEGAAVLEAFLEGAWTVGRGFAERRGYEVFIRDLFLSRPPTPFDAPPVAGLVIRPFVFGVDDATWAELVNATLSRDAGFVNETPESVVGYARAPGFALWIGEVGGGPAGFCHLERRGAIGYVQGIGVVREHEGRGVGAALLSRGIETLREGSVERIELCTEEDNARAQRLYARAGFTLDRDAFTMRKRL